MDCKLNHKNQSSKTSKTQNCNGKTPKIHKAIASIKPYNNQKCSTNSISSPIFSSPKRRQKKQKEKKRRKKTHNGVSLNYLKPTTDLKKKIKPRNSLSSLEKQKKQRKHLQLNWGHPAFTFLEGLQKRKHKKRRGKKNNKQNPPHSHTHTNTHPFKHILTHIGK